MATGVDAVSLVTWGLVGGAVTPTPTVVEKATLELLKSLRDRIKTILGGKIGQRVYFSRAPKHVDFPYVLIHLVVGTLDATFTENLETPTIQISLFSENNSVEEASELGEEIMESLDWGALTVPGFDSIWVKNTSFRLAKDAGDVFHFWVDYDLRLQKQET